MKAEKPIKINGVLVYGSIYRAALRAWRKSGLTRSQAAKRREWIKWIKANAKPI